VVLVRAYMRVWLRARANLCACVRMCVCVCMRAHVHMFALGGGSLRDVPTHETDCVKKGMLFIVRNIGKATGMTGTVVVWTT